MGVETRASEFFVAGGTLRADAPSYVKRPADDELFKLASAGEFCYVLTARQMGKSSLMIRTARRLHEQGVRTAVVDLTKIGTDVSAEQWYLGLITRLAVQLRLSVDPDTWWATHASLGAVQRFTDFLHDVVLGETDGPVVIFIDEIDTTLSLDFSDDFFAAVRFVYNARASDPAYNRLTFVLLGVSMPTDLIKDRRRTPFNIGQAIDLREFSREDAQVLQRGLQAARPEHGQAIFDRVFYWTGGHPYLTQKLCLAAAEAGDGRWTDERVDALVESLFLSEEARKETNLQFVRDSVGTSPQRRRLLTLYRRVYEGRTVPEDERSLDQNRLKLFGLVQAERGVLIVRNEIYRRAFNREWIKANTPVDWTRRIAVTTTLVAVVLAAIAGVYAWQQGKQTGEVLAQDYENRFRNTANPTLRLDSLASLFDLEGYSDRARSLFDSLAVEERMAVFTSVPPDLQPQFRKVVRGTYTYIGDTEDNNHVLRAMQSALAQSEEAESTVLASEIAHWLDGRALAAQGDYEEAGMAYSVAVALNDRNPATHFERALMLAAMGDCEGALVDFEKVLSLNGDWQGRVRQAVISDDQLYLAFWHASKAYSELATLVPTPTPTSTPTDTPTPTPTPTDTPTPTPTITPTPTPTPLPLRNIPIPVHKFGNDDIRNILPGFPIGNVTLGGVEFAISDGQNKISTQCDRDAYREWPTSISVPVGNINGAESVYVLINSGYSYARYEGAQIGLVALEFSDGRLLRFPLILGKNLREWSPASDTVNTASGSFEVWTGSDHTNHPAAIDMLTLSIPQDYQSSSLHTVTFHDISQDTLNGDLNPCFFVVGITVNARD